MARSVFALLSDAAVFSNYAPGDEVNSPVVFTSEPWACDTDPSIGVPVWVFEGRVHGSHGGWVYCESLHHWSEPHLMVSQGYVGILDRTAMDSFADIFVALQKKNKAKNEAGTRHVPLMMSNKFDRDQTI